MIKVREKLISFTPHPQRPRIYVLSDVSICECDTYKTFLLTNFRVTTVCHSFFFSRQGPSLNGSVTIAWGSGPCPLSHATGTRTRLRWRAPGGAVFQLSLAGGTGLLFIGKLLVESKRPAHLLLDTLEDPSRGSSSAPAGGRLDTHRGRSCPIGEPSITEGIY